LKALGIETAFGPGALSLRDGAAVLAEGVLPPGRRHSAGLLPLLEELLLRVGWVPRDLELVGVGTGPGSFTGLRVGAALGQGLAFALGIPLVGVGSFRALAAAYAGPEEEVSVFSDARRRRAYAARYRRRDGETVEVKAPAVIPFGEVGDFAAGGALISPNPGELAEEGEIRLAAPSPREVARLAAAALAAGDGGDPRGLKPIYLGSHYRARGGIACAP